MRQLRGLAMIALRKLALCLHLLRGVLTCALLFPWCGARAREDHIRRWSRRLLRICGVELELMGAVPETRRGAMVVANHISWLDIFVIHSWYPARFVAKSEIRGWPVVGWLCEKTGTLFIERGRKRDAHRVLHDITDCMLQGDRVCVFPEGTTSDGTDLLPFHANLMQAPLSGGLPVLPVALVYVDAATGQRTTAPAYIGEMTLLQTLDAILRAPPMRAQLRFAEALQGNDASRRLLAERAREAILLQCQTDMGSSPDRVMTRASAFATESEAGPDGQRVSDALR